MNMTERLRGLWVHAKKEGEGSLGFEMFLVYCLGE